MAAEAAIAGPRRMQDILIWEQSRLSCKKKWRRRKAAQREAEAAARRLVSPEWFGWCFNCGRPGHRKADCTFDMICIHCGLEGHEAKDCERPKTPDLDDELRRMALAKRARRGEPRREEPNPRPMPGFERGDPSAARGMRLEEEEVEAPLCVVDLVIEGVPPHAFDREIIEDLLGTSCAISELAPETMSRSDLAAIKVSAWTNNPELIPPARTLVIPDPEEPSDETHSPALEYSDVSQTTPLVKPESEKKMLKYKVLIHLDRIVEETGWEVGTLLHGGESGFPEDRGFGGGGAGGRISRRPPWCFSVSDRRRGAWSGNANAGGQGRSYCQVAVSTVSWRLPPMGGRTHAGPARRAQTGSLNPVVSGKEKECMDHQMQSRAADKEAFPVSIDRNVDAVGTMDATVETEEPTAVGPEPVASEASATQLASSGSASSQGSSESLEGGATGDQRTGGSSVHTSLHDEFIRVLLSGVEEGAAEKSPSPSPRKGPLPFLDREQSLAISIEGETPHLLSVDPSPTLSLQLQ
ncbi:hypothetical protein ACQ4PT_069440 [Festuca glaucescens]